MSDLQSITISNKLKIYFERQSISQNQIAERLGVSQPAISALLNGKPFGKSTAKKWSDEFGIKPNWLLTGEGEMLKSDELPQEDEQTEGCECPMNDLLKSVLENSRAITDTMKDIVDSNASLIKQQTELIATIRALAEKK